MNKINPRFRRINKWKVVTKVTLKVETLNNSPSVVRHVRLLIGNSAVVEFFRPLRGAPLPTSPGSVGKALSCAVHRGTRRTRDTGYMSLVG